MKKALILVALIFIGLSGTAQAIPWKSEYLLCQHEQEYPRCFSPRELW